MKRNSLLGALLLTCTLGVAHAQIGMPVQDFAQRLQGTLAGNVIELKRGRVTVTPLENLVYRVQYAGDADDTLTAARVLAQALGQPGLVGTVVGALEEHAAELRGGAVHELDVGEPYRLTLSWDDRLRFELRLVEHTGFGRDRHVLGRGGPVIREFSDFQCPYCKRLADTTLVELKKQYLDAGGARFSYRHFPLDSIHEYALPLAVGAECAARQGQFFAYHDAVFAKSGQVPPLAVAQQLRLNIPAFTRCLTEPDVTRTVLNDRLIGQTLGVGGTPTVFVGPFRVPDAYDPAAYAPLLRLAQALQRQPLSGR